MTLYLPFVNPLVKVRSYQKPIQSYSSNVICDTNEQRVHPYDLVSKPIKSPYEPTKTEKAGLDLTQPVAKERMVA